VLTNSKHLELFISARGDHVSYHLRNRWRSTHFPHQCELPFSSRRENDTEFNILFAIFFWLNLRLDLCIYADPGT